MKNYTFSGHDTFAIRHGWLKKSYDRAIKLNARSEDVINETISNQDRSSELFEHQKAMATFGVGKNMVRSMRYWALASGFLRLVDKNKYEISKLANLLLSSTGTTRGVGLDPYFENATTIWLLHWEIATNREFCTSWDFAFSRFARTIFKKSDLSAALEAFADDAGWIVSANSIEKDVNCLLQMYCAESSRVGGLIKEESLECPLSELRLISRDAASGGFRFEIGPKKNLSPYVLYYAIARYAEGRQNRLLSLDEIFYDHGSPGRVFKLDETSMCSILEGAADKTEGDLVWEETGPLRQIRISDTLEAPLDLLSRAYELDDAMGEAA